MCCEFPVGGWGFRMAAADKEELEVRAVVAALKTRGVTVRREKLARGNAYRVKSGSCEVFGEDVVFVDKDLPAKQQAAILIDYFLDRGWQFEPSEIEVLSPGNRSLAKARAAESTPAE